DWTGPMPILTHTSNSIDTARVQSARQAQPNRPLTDVLAAVTAKPLFSPTRTAAPADPAEGYTAADVAADLTESSDYQLVGVVITPTMRMAMIANQSGDVQHI